MVILQSPHTTYRRHFVHNTPVEQVEMVPTVSTTPTYPGLGPSTGPLPSKAPPEARSDEIIIFGMLEVKSPPGNPKSHWLMQNPGPGLPHPCLPKSNPAEKRAGKGVDPLTAQNFAMGIASQGYSEANPEHHQEAALASKTPAPCWPPKAPPPTFPTKSSSAEPDPTLRPAP